MDDLSTADQLFADEVQGIYVQKTLFYFFLKFFYNVFISIEIIFNRVRSTFRSFLGLLLQNISSKSTF